jgi:hypothetical protein
MCFYPSKNIWIYYIMFSEIHSSALGKSSCSKGSPYTPLNSGVMEVAFRPIKNTSGTVNYIALIESEIEKAKIIIPKEMEIDDYEIDDSNENNTKITDIFDIDNDYIKTFYIGSVTIVGLYILYSILDKSK